MVLAFIRRMTGVNGAPALLAGRRAMAVEIFATDAEAEIYQGRDADHEADEGVEAFEGDDGEDTEAASVGHGVAEDGNDGGEHRKKDEG